MGPGEETVARQAGRLVPDGEDEPGDEEQIERETHALPPLNTQANLTGQARVEKVKMS